MANSNVSQPSGSGGGSNVVSAVERSQRSIFVGNISYEATEEELREIFSQVGPVVHWRLVFDRDTGKPKGYGFCEYVDQETANSAIRNLNGFELHGRPIRVDSAAGSEKNKEEVRQLQMTLGGPSEESPYGPAVEPSKAPEAISRAVASLPPEQMFELMKQMKLCIQNNPNEARNMLLQNPQLAYALLQAQVVMRIVDPQVAITMLHRDTGPPSQPIMPPQSTAGPSTSFPGINPAMMGIRGPPPGFNVMAGANMPRADVDLRSMGAPGGQFNRPPPPMRPAMQPSAAGGFSGLAQNPSNAGDDQEKAALIMQVLQLTEEQINMLPPDQKQSVLILREQLRNAQK